MVKAPVFDTGIRWFESTLPRLLHPFYSSVMISGVLRHLMVIGYAR